MDGKTHGALIRKSLRRRFDRKNVTGSCLEAKASLACLVFFFFYHALVSSAQRLSWVK